MRKLLIPLLAAIVLLSGCETVSVRHSVSTPVEVVGHTPLHRTTVIVHQHDGPGYYTNRHKHYLPVYEAGYTRSSGYLGEDYPATVSSRQVSVYASGHRHHRHGDRIMLQPTVVVHNEPAPVRHPRHHHASKQADRRHGQPGQRVGPDRQVITPRTGVRGSPHPVPDRHSRQAAKPQPVRPAKKPGGRHAAGTKPASARAAKKRETQRKRETRGVRSTARPKPATVAKKRTPQAAPEKKASTQPAKRSGRSGEKRKEKSRDSEEKKKGWY